MMTADVISEKQVTDRLLRMYDKSPKGWRFYSGISDKGDPEILITGQESWQLRRDRYVPGRTGVAVRIEGSIEHPVNDEVYSGFRPIPDVVMHFIIDMIARGANIRDVDRVLYNNARRIVRHQDPISNDEIDDIKPAGILQGPILRTQRPLQSIIGGQAELDEKLDYELEKLKRKFSSGYIG